MAWRVGPEWRHSVHLWRRVEPNPGRGRPPNAHPTREGGRRNRPTIFPPGWQAIPGFRQWREEFDSACHAGFDGTYDGSGRRRQRAHSGADAAREDVPPVPSEIRFVRARIRGTLRHAAWQTRPGGERRW